MNVVGHVHAETQYVAAHDAKAGAGHSVVELQLLRAIPLPFIRIASQVVSETQDCTAQCAGAGPTTT